MIYSYSQLNSYLNCPRAYRYRYVDGWQEPDTNASILFGRAFEKALAAFFRREDSAAALFDEWRPFQAQKLQYRPGDTWDRMFHQGVTLLNRFAQDDRIHIPRPNHDVQVRVTRQLEANDTFVAHVDALGFFDGERCLVEWKTTSRRYPEEPANLFSLDPQLVSYSWATGIPDAVVVVFVRKQLAEIQYIPVTISEEQWADFDKLVTETVARINASGFSLRSGVRFPQNHCVSCSYLGLCLNNDGLKGARLLREHRDDLVWIDELAY